MIRHDKTIRRTFNFSVRKNGVELGKIEVDIVASGLDQGTRAEIREWLDLAYYEMSHISPQRKTKKVLKSRTNP